jgi:hypothetical protein
LLACFVMRECFCFTLLPDACLPAYSKKYSNDLLDIRKDDSNCLSTLGFDRVQQSEA